MDNAVTFEFSKEFLEQFQNALQEQDEGFIKESLEGVNPADISAFLDEFNAKECKYVLNLLDTEIAANVINELDEDVRDEFLESYQSEQIAEIVDQLETDDGADILLDLTEEEQQEVIESMEDEEKAQNIKELLDYDEDVAGGLMAKELIKANGNWTIKQCIEEIRKQAENVEKIYSVYVIDDQEKLLGKVSLKKIILTPDATKVGQIYDDEVVSVESLMPEDEVAAVMRKYDLDAVPVVDEENHLLGRITNDDIIDVITELAEEERQLMAGITNDVEEDDSVWMLTRARLPWLVIGVIGGFISARFIGVFEEELARITAIAFFIPLIQATGGNVGIQSSSIVVQSLASPSAFTESTIKRLLKVFLVALLNGLVLAAIVYGFNLLTGGEGNLSLVVSIALFGVVLIASFLGTVTPLVLNKFGFNPALASGPFITTTNDLLGLAIYFYTVHLLL